MMYGSYKDCVFPGHEDYEDYMSNQPMTDGEEIRSFLDDDDDETENKE